MFTENYSTKRRSDGGHVPMVWRSNGDAIAPVLWTEMHRPSPPGNARERACDSLYGPHRFSVGVRRLGITAISGLPRLPQMKGCFIVGLSLSRARTRSPSQGPRAAPGGLSDSDMPIHQWSAACPIRLAARSLVPGVAPARSTGMPRSPLRSLWIR